MIRGLVSVALFAALFVGCDPGLSRACTEIGCSSGVLVEIENPPPGPYAVIVRSQHGPIGRVECEGGVCSGLFFETTAEVVTVIVEIGDDVHEFEFEPVYERLQPNGPGCPPVCYQATVQIHL